MGGLASGAIAISILTATQRRFLEHFFRDSSDEEPFYLSGGTALAEFYLRHRYSDDLDFFTRSDESLADGERRARVTAQGSGLTVREVRAASSARRLSLEGDPIAEHRLVKVELMLDTPPYPMPPRRFGSVHVDDLLCIAVNKTAIDRDEPKDYVDLYFILQEGGYSLENLVAQAIQKDPGLNEFSIAQKFMRAKRLPDLKDFERAYMLKRVEWRDMIGFYESAAVKLFELFPPPEEK